MLKRHCSGKQEKEKEERNKECRLLMKVEVLELNTMDKLWLDSYHSKKITHSLISNHQIRNQLINLLIVNMGRLL
jgi:hypothetical protein